MSERRLEWALSLGLLGVTALFALWLAPVQPDAAYIGYRYARHVAQGTGFAYNLGDGRHIAVAPLYVLALADASQFIPNLPALGVAFSALFVGGGGLLLLLAGRDERGLPERAFAALAYVAFPLWWLETGVETALVGFLALAALFTQARQRHLAAATLAGLALVVRPISLLLGLVLLVDTALDQRRIPWREALALFLLAILWAVLATWAFGWPLPPRVLLGGSPAGGSLMTHPTTSRALTGLVRVGGGLLAQSWLWGGVFLLAGLGLARVLSRWWLVTLLVWALLHGLALDIMGVMPSRGDYVPLALAFAATLGVGVTFAAEALSERVSRGAVIATAALLMEAAILPSLWAIRQAPTRDDAYYTAHGPAMLPDIPQSLYQLAGKWLAENTPRDAVVSAGHVGQLGYYAGRDMFDTGGLLHPTARQGALHGDAFWYLPQFAPDYAVLSRTSLHADEGYRPLDDAWFSQTYAETTRFGDAATLGGPLAIYERLSEPPTLAETEAEAHFENGLRLEDVATNLVMDPLSTDQLALFRLEWLPGRALPDEQLIVLRLESRAGVSAGQIAQLDLTGQWTPGIRLTTYHSFETASALVPGLYELKVGVGPTPDELEWQVVARAKVPLAGEPFGGGLTGGGGRWPELAVLRGFRLNLSEDTLGVALLWESLADLDADYTVRLALLDDEGEVVAEVEGPPRDDAYPTSIWADGEQVADEHLIDLEGVPAGEYALHASWLDAEGAPVPAEDGQPTLEVARVFVE